VRGLADGGLPRHPPTPQDMADFFGTQRSRQNRGAQKGKDRPAGISPWFMEQAGRTLLALPSIACLPPGIRATLGGRPALQNSYQPDPSFKAAARTTARRLRLVIGNHSQPASGFP
jgi:hypothetical protein